MATKNNIRSFRYSDRVAEILEQQEGKTLNEKFENLVLFCFDEKPNTEKQLKLIKSKIIEFSEFSKLISTYYSRLENMKYTISTCDTQLKALTDNIEKVFNEV
jgi:hypothetical protein